MNGMLMQQRINAELPGMSRAEKKVARALLSDYPSAGLLPVAKLAGLSDVSAPSVLKFVRRLGFERYLEFQGRLLNELSQKNPPAQERHEETFAELEGHNPVRHIARSYGDNLVTSLAKIPVAELDHSIQLLSNLKLRVTCTGGRFTEYLAKHLSMCLHQLRPGVRYSETDYGCRNEHIPDINNKDALVVIDVWQYQKDTVNFAREAGRKGAKIILITDPELSPIASTATCVLPVETRRASSSFFNLNISALVELLIAGVSEKLGKEAKDRKKRMMDMRLSLVHVEND